MGVEVKSGDEGVIVADRGCNDGCCNRNNSGWGSGWGAVGGALVGGGFGAAAVSIWQRRSITRLKPAPIWSRESRISELVLYPKSQSPLSVVKRLLRISLPTPATSFATPLIS